MKYLVEGRASPPVPVCAGDCSADSMPAVPRAALSLPKGRLALGAAMSA
jgi:hypothetical protein